MRVGIVGLGFMGMIHYLAYQRVRGCQVVALCEQDPKKRKGDWRSIKGNFGPQGKRMDLTGVSCYSKIDDLLNDPNVDVVDICLPPALHSQVAALALSASKDVFCEKPMALTTNECQVMTRAAQKMGRQLWIGHVLPFFPQYQKALDLVQSNKHGRLLGGHFTRVISDPKWLKSYYDPKVVGGPLLDLTIHDTHFIRLLFGMPQKVTSTGRMRGEVVQYVHSTFDFGKSSQIVTLTGGTIDQPARPFRHGFEIHMENGTLFFEFSALEGVPSIDTPLTFLPARGKGRRVALKTGDDITPFENEIREVKRSFTRGEISEVLDSSLASDVISIVHKQAESVEKQKTVRFRS
ncbi:MAG: Gfo/Idh/MocA family oxidoreductase [Pirellulaceae bacterium]|nr:Gfo/Idh/MocA family oxidoreductase [Pirellulaceae bacterium]